MRKAKKNVRHEMRSAIMNSFREGMNKRDLKRRNEAEGKVFSYGSKFALLDRVNDFCKTLPKGITLDELKPEHVRAYLDEKAKTCTQVGIEKDWRLRWSGSWLRANIRQQNKFREQGSAIRNLKG